jgi:1,4-dihydroxy-2-naphthoate octaprenyltransferase
VTLRRLKNEHVFTLGALCSALSVVFERFTNLQYSDFSISDFMSGVFTGLSLVLFLFFLLNFRKSLKESD